MSRSARPSCPPSRRLSAGPAGGRRALLLRTAAVVAAVALAAGACAGDDDTDDDTAEVPADTGTPSSPEDRGDAAPDADGGQAATVTTDELAEASGGAPAATGAGLDDDRPGPAERTGLPGVGEVAASITAADGTVTGCCLLVAATQDQRQRGLMEVTDLGGYQGMVFVWDDDVEGGFWMRNTPMPLSIAWFDADGAFVSAADMDPCPATADDCPTYPPEGPYRFALEVAQGELDALGVGPGSRLALGGECAGGAPS